MAVLKLWGLQHRPLPLGLIKTVSWQLLFWLILGHFHSRARDFAELWESALTPSGEVAVLSSRLALPHCPFFGLPVFQVVSRPRPSLPIDCSVSCLLISHLLLLCTHFFAWPLNSSFCSPQVCSQTSLIPIWSLSLFQSQSPRKTKYLSPPCPRISLIAPLCK